MSLTPGTRLGSYEIVSPLGAGGMGEVFRARDTKLNRDVAIKVLPESFALDADRVARFTREAQVLASLNHPNIAAIYGIEESGSTRALVMELVEGEDLSAHIARGAMPLGDALPIAKQIADALEAAHEQGIVHRDLKPQNIKVRADGTVKVLDFGLAKAMDPDASGASAMNSPTMTARATQMGMIIGTAAYMSPEQARGKAVDRRADVWAFGVVLYEMLTGRRAFEGSEVSDVLASVLKDTLPLDALPASTPAPIRRLLRRCLEKDRPNRLDSMAAARLEIADALTTGRDNGLPATVAVAPNRLRTTLMAAAAVVAASALTGVVVWRARTPEPPLPMSFVLPSPVAGPLQINVNQPGLAISHDGRKIVYGQGEVGRGLTVRSLDQFGDTVLKNIGEQPRSPFFSPDDKWVGYFSASSNGTGAHLMKVAPSGGAPLEIAPVSGNLRGASWGRDGSIVFASTAPDTGLLRVPAGGGKPEVLTVPDLAAGEVDHVWPVFMPDGKHVVFTVTERPNDGTSQTVRKLAVVDLATRKWRVIKDGASFPRFALTGHLLFATEQGLFAAPFDPVACEFRGEAARVVEDVGYRMSSGAADVDVSDAGTLAFVAGPGVRMKTLAWVERDGAVTPIAAPPLYYEEAVLSPDQTRVALSITDEGGTTLHVYDLARGSLTRITPPGKRGASPVWSADERFIYYRAPEGIARVSAAGTGSPELIMAAKPGDLAAPTSVTPDGRSIVLRVLVGGQPEIQLLNLEGAPSPKRLIADGDGSLDGRISPDGHWLAYTVRTGSSGFGQVFVRPFPDVNGDRRQVSIDSGSKPVWARNSRAIFYTLSANSDTIWRVDLGGNGQLGKPVQVMSVTPGVGQVTNIPTGDDRILRIHSVVDDGATNELRVVLNWFEVLKQKMASGK